MLALGIFRDPGCGGADASESAVNAPCTRDHDCRSGLVCSKGVCVSSSEVKDAGIDSARADASSDAGDGGA
jgi:hypothetical protein